MTVSDAYGLTDLSRFDILIAEIFVEPVPAALLWEWVENGGALMTMIIGVGDGMPCECVSTNSVIEPLGIRYDCDHQAPWGPVTKLDPHPIAEGISGANTPFCNGRWVDEVPGFETRSVARVGEACERKPTAKCDPTKP